MLESASGAVSSTPAAFAGGGAGTARDSAIDDLDDDFIPF
jgi:hypothetical protein